LGIFAALLAVAFFFLPGQFSQTSPTGKPVIADSTVKAVSMDLTQPPDTTVGLPTAQRQQTASKDGTRHPQVNPESTVKGNLQPPSNSQKTAEIEAKITTSEPPTIEPVPQIGKLEVQCTPWAEVWVDGQSIDTTPLRKPIALSAGRHQIELRNPEFPPYVETIELAAGETRQLTVNLRQLVGYLDLKVVPWAKIYLNNRYIETTPLPKPLPLPPGTYLLRLENPAFPAKTDTVVIAAGQIINKRITLK
jgi:serine/threonine-protein kinase